mmetsp:Transcript_14522/g.48123  ORF Transcript_14522/g.48123 Transcript_14522/m.48123 type:complete len:281 (+) Transcript_14522:1628-2470(+)
MCEPHVLLRRRLRGRLRVRHRQPPPAAQVQSAEQVVHRGARGGHRRGRPSQTEKVKLNMLRCGLCVGARLRRCPCTSYSTSYGTRPPPVRERADARNRGTRLLPERAAGRRRGTKRVIVVRRIILSKELRHVRGSQAPRRTTRLHCTHRFVRVFRRVIAIYESQQFIRERGRDAVPSQTVARFREAFQNLLTGRQPHAAATAHLVHASLFLGSGKPLLRIRGGWIRPAGLGATTLGATTRTTGPPSSALRVQTALCRGLRALHRGHETSVTGSFGYVNRL